MKLLNGFAKETQCVFILFAHSRSQVDFEKEETLKNQNRERKLKKKITMQLVELQKQFQLKSIKLFIICV